MIKQKYAVTSVQLILLAYFVRLVGFEKTQYELPWYILIFVLLIWLVYYQDGITTVSNCAWLREMGAWSYSIYIMQFPCFHYYELLIDRGVFHMRPGTYVIAGLLICVVTGILVYYAVERPVYSLYQKRRGLTQTIRGDGV